MQLEIALLICNQTVVSIATIWLQQLKVANIAAINWTWVALGLLIFQCIHLNQKDFTDEKQGGSEKKTDSLSIVNCFAKGGRFF